MKTSDVHEEHKKAYIIEQLNELGYTQTDGLTYAELVNRLAVCRAMEIKEDRPGFGWF